MKIRLEGSEGEIKEMIESLKQHYSLPTISRLYPNRGRNADRDACRCYIELLPLSQSSPNQGAFPRPGDAVLGGGGQRSQ
jgi:hypothetical protein